MPERTIGDKIHAFITDLVRDGKEDTSFGLTESGRSARNIRALREDPIHTSIVDSEGKFPSSIAPSGVFEVGELIRLVGGNFEVSVLPHRWRSDILNGGSFSVIEGELVLQTNVAGDGIARIQSFNRAEFVTATFNKAHMAVGIDLTQNDVITRWGMFDPVNPFDLGDGVFVQALDGDFSFQRIKGGVIDEVVLEADFDFLPKLKKNNNINVWEIVYNAGSAFLYQNRNLIHKMSYVDEVGYETTHLPVSICIENINGNITNNIIKTRGFSCSRIGASSAVPEKFNITSTVPDQIIKHGPGLVERIVLGETGAGNSTITLFDGNDVFFGPISLTKSLFSLEIGASFSDNLNMVTTGAGFQVMVVYR